MLAAPSPCTPRWHESAVTSIFQDNRTPQRSSSQKSLEPTLHRCQAQSQTRADMRPDLLKGQADTTRQRSRRPSVTMVKGRWNSKSRSSSSGRVQIMESIRSETELG